MRKFTLLFILISTIGYSQTIVTKFKLSGVLFSDKNLDSDIITKFKKKKDVIVLDYQLNDWWKVDVDSNLGFVTSTMLVINEDMLKIKKYKQDEILAKAKEKEKARLKEIERKDNLIKLRSKRRREKRDSLDYIKQVKKDSIKRVKEEKWKITKIEREKEELEKIKMYLSKFTKINKKQSCAYVVDEIDEFTNKVRKRTTRFTFSGEKNGWGPSIKFVRYGLLKYVIFNASTDLGCVTSYSNDKSYVFVKLENGMIVKFYHFGDTDCGNDFSLSGKLTASDINNLKKSPIKSIRMSGTKYYHDFTNVKFKNIFINKLDCIN